MYPQIQQKLLLNSVGIAFNPEQAQQACAYNMVQQLFQHRVMGPCFNQTNPGPLGFLYNINCSLEMSTRPKNTDKFFNDNLANNFTIATYLKENCNLNVHEINKLTKIYHHIEYAIKKVSDHLHEDEMIDFGLYGSIFENGQDEGSNDAQTGVKTGTTNFSQKIPRTIVGVKRVGLDHMFNIFLNKFDPELAQKIGYQDPKSDLKLAILCSRRVTRKLLKNIFNLLLDALKSSEALFYNKQEIYFNKQQYWKRVFLYKFLEMEI